jgi:hypothetical protein
LKEGQLFSEADLNIASEAENRLSAHPSRLLNGKRDKEEKVSQKAEHLIQRNVKRSASIS